MVNTQVDTSKKTDTDSAQLLKSAQESKELARSKAMEMLNTVINDEKTSKENKDKATAELTAMASNMEKEGVAEGMIKTKGFEDCVVFITNDMVSVAVKAESTLAATDIAKIQDAIKSCTNIGADKITITQVK